MFHAPVEPESSLPEAENQQYAKRNVPEGLSAVLHDADDTIMLSALLDLLFPRRSLTGDEGDLVTAAELRSLRSDPVILDGPALRAQGMTSLDRIVAAAAYDDVPMLHRAIHLFKYRKVKGMSEVLGDLLVDASFCLQGEAEASPVAVRVGEGGSPTLCPVPLHWIRKFSRGFNQAELLARVVGRERGWGVRSLLKRVRWTGSQVGRKRNERLNGVRNAFSMRSGVMFPRHVILIDDLSTTGATLNECAIVLKNAGVRKVEGLVIALG